MPELDPQQQRAFAINVVERLRAAGFAAYWAGGCVRDQLQGVLPKDYDVATDARPEQIRDLFGRRRTLAMGAAFGVITVLGRKPEGQIEVATFRQDAPYSDGRHPDEVTFSTPELDARRRDFTINGLFFDPVKDEVIDFVGGRDDLRRKLVRAIGDPRARIAEDKLRMLRAVRFAAVFEFELEAETLRAIEELAGQVSVVSAERIGAEIRRMLVDTSRPRAVELLHESQLLDAVLPEVAALASDAQPGGAWAETLRALATLDEPSLPLALAVLLHRAAGESSLARSVGRRLRFSNKEIERTAWLLDNYSRAIAAEAEPWPQLQRLLISPGINELLALADAFGSPHAAGPARCRTLLALPPIELNPPPLVTGDDLIAHGVAPGKAFRVLLERVRDAQLEKQIATPQEALSLVDRLQAEGDIE